MFAWTALLVAQPLLIRSGWRHLHRVAGRVSYLLVPVIVASTLVLANYQVGRRGLSPVGTYLLLLQLTLLLQFVVLYGLGIRARKRPDVHARYMVCTALPLIDPIFARIIAIYFPPSGNLFAGQLLTFGLTDLVLLALVAWDWRSMRRRDVFLRALPVVLILQAAVFLLAGSAAWAAFSAWFMDLPIS